METFNYKSQSQRKLYGFSTSFNELINLNKSKKLPNKILLTGRKGIGKATFAYHFANFILSENEEFKYDCKNFFINRKNKSFQLVLNNSHPNFFIIDLLEDKKNIDINQIRQMIEYSNKTTFIDNRKFILIDNVEKLNKNSVNALLKIIEEPNSNMFFLLIFDNSKPLLDTLKSRCIKFSLTLNFDKSIHVTNKILNDEIFNYINKDLINYYDSPGNLIRLYNFGINEKIDLKNFNLKDFLIYLLNNNTFKKDLYIKKNIFKFIEFYLYVLLLNNNSIKNIYSIYSYFVKKIFDMERFNLDPEVLLIEFRNVILND
jgi:DNA polymerase-3 subunit delta'